MILYPTNRSRPHQESVFVIMTAGSVEVCVKTQLRCVPFGEEILAVNIGNNDLLIARIEFIEIRVGVLLAHIEKGEIILPAVIVIVSENPNAQIRIVKNKPAEIADEGLNTQAGRN